jgi:hypothetical protein
MSLRARSEVIAKTDFVLPVRNIMSDRLTMIPVGAGSPISIRKTRNFVNPPCPIYYLRSTGHDISPKIASVFGCVSGRITHPTSNSKTGFLNSAAYPNL